MDDPVAKEKYHHWISWKICYKIDRSLYRVVILREKVKNTFLIIHLKLWKNQSPKGHIYPYPALVMIAGHQPQKEQEGTKSCRIQGKFVGLYVRPSIPTSICHPPRPLGGLAQAPQRSGPSHSEAGSGLSEAGPGLSEAGARQLDGFKMPGPASERPGPDSEWPGPGLLRARGRMYSTLFALPGNQVFYVH